MRFKTLVINKGTEFQEFYGYMDDYGWVTCQSPIHNMSEDVTWDEVKNQFPDKDFNGVYLVTIEIKITEDIIINDDGTCCDCGKLRNWVGGPHSKYRCANYLENYLEK